MLCKLNTEVKLLILQHLPHLFVQWKAALPSSRGLWGYLAWLTVIEWLILLREPVETHMAVVGRRAPQLVTFSYYPINVVSTLPHLWRPFARIPEALPGCCTFPHLRQANLCPSDLSLTFFLKSKIPSKLLSVLWSVIPNILPSVKSIWNKAFQSKNWALPFTYSEQLNILCLYLKQKTWKEKCQEGHNCSFFPNHWLNCQFLE